MVANPTQSISDPPTKVTYPVLLEAVAGGWIATIPGLVTGRAIGETREIALDRLQQMITQNLSFNDTGELTHLEIALPSSSEHPSMKFAGMFQDDPYFDQVLEHMEAFRQKDREEYLRQLDAEAAALSEKPA